MSRIYDKIWTMACASKIGHSHHVRGDNCQDACRIGQKGDYLFGVVCDGCGGVDDDQGNIISENEVAAKLISRFVVSSISSLLPCQVSGIPASLFVLVNGYIRNLVSITCDAYDELDFINTSCLATIIGFVIGPESAIIFHCGDGIIVSNDKHIRIDQNNHPSYLAYGAVNNPAEAGLLSQDMPNGFESYELPINELNRLMIATDGFELHSLTKLELSRLKNPDLPLSLYGQQWGKTGQFGLKKWMNVQWALGYFDDDCAIVTVEIC